MSRGFRFETRPLGWIIPTAMQLVPPLMIAIGLPFTPGNPTVRSKLTEESPRWLVLKGKNDLALGALNKLRHKREVESGQTALEIAAFDQAIEEDKQLQGGGWLDLMRGTYRRRTFVSGQDIDSVSKLTFQLAMFMFIFQQTTGGQFLLSYGPT